MNKTFFLYIAGGGAIGALGRYFLSTWIYNNFGNGFPLGTFSVNIVGSFLLGLIYSLTLEGSLLAPLFRALVMIGVLGAFTTFSTFSLETVILIREGHSKVAIYSILSNVVGGIAAIVIGMVVANFF